MNDPERDEKICDFCGSTGILWAWETPNEVSSHEEAKAKQTFWVEDPWWYACDTCHRMILAGKRDSILERGILRIGNGLLVGFDEQGVGQVVDPNEHIGAVHSVFWDHKNDIYEEVTK